MRILSTIAATALCLAAPAQSPLTTIFASDINGAVGGAIYFDLVVHTPITITAVAVNVMGNGSVDVFTCPGGRGGNQTNVLAWTLVGTGTVSGSFNAMTPVTGLGPIPLAAGTYGVVYRANGVNHAYTDGTGSNQSWSTAELTLNAGEASNVPFAAPLATPRVVNTRITYQLGASGSLATDTSYGVGCVQKFASFYEFFPSPASYDLSGTNLSMFPAGNGYAVLPGITTYVQPPVSATVLALGDDTEVAVTLASPFPVRGGPPVASLHVCSNGFISTASNGTSYTPTPQAMLSNGATGWYHWHDFDVTAAGSGQVKFHEAGNVSYVTWDGVWDWGGTSGASASTLQFQFDRATGKVHLCMVSMSTLGEGVLVGYSPGGPSVDPGNLDITATLPVSFILSGTDVVPLTLAGTTRPLLGAGWQLTTANIPAGTAFGAVLLGFTQYGVGLPLASIGMPGCFRYTDGAGGNLFVSPGASSTFTLNIPNDNSYLGAHVYAQSVTFSPPATALGAIASNGLDGRLGNL